MINLQTDNLALLDIWVKLSMYGWVYVLAERVRFLIGGRTMLDFTAEFSAVRFLQNK